MRSEKWVRERYWGQELSLRQMADEAGVSPMTIRNWMIRYDVPRRTGAELAVLRSRKMSGRRNPAYKHGRNVDHHKHMAEWLKGKRCQWCGSDHEIRVRYENRDHTDASPDNLIVLCPDCAILEDILYKKRAVVVAGKGKIAVAFTREI